MRNGTESAQRDEPLDGSRSKAPIYTRIHVATKLQTATIITNRYSTAEHSCEFIPTFDFGSTWGHDIIKSLQVGSHLFTVATLSL